MEQNIIPGVAPLRWGESGETTFAGALAHASEVLPEKADYARIMGDTGLAFRARWFDPAAGASYIGVAPVGEGPEEIALTRASLGLTIKVVDVEKSDTVKREAVHQELIASIDEGRPVICYVDPHMDCALAYGYRDHEGKTLVVSDYYPETAADQKFENLGSFFLFLEPGGQPLSRREAVLKGLSAAVGNWSRESAYGDGGRFFYGGGAFDHWRASLTAVNTNGKGQGLSNHVNWWNFDCLCDSRTAAVKYLRASADLFTEPARVHILKAADLYEQERALAAKATFEDKNAFLGPWTGKKDQDWTPDVRVRESALLTRCEDLEAQAIAELRKALESA